MCISINTPSLKPQMITFHFSPELIHPNNDISIAPKSRHATVTCILSVTHWEKQRQAWNRHYKCLTEHHQTAKDKCLSSCYLLLLPVPSVQNMSILSVELIFFFFVQLHILPTHSLACYVPLIFIDQHWFDLYWFGRAQFLGQSVGKWIPFYFNLPQRRSLNCNTKAMSLQPWKELLKDPFEVATEERSCHLTLFSVLLKAVIV